MENPVEENTTFNPEKQSSSLDLSNWLSAAIPDKNKYNTFLFPIHCTLDRVLSVQYITLSSQHAHLHHLSLSFTGL